LLTFLLDIYSMSLPFIAGIKKWNIDHVERQYPSPYDMNHGMDEILSRILYSIQEFCDFLMKNLNFLQRQKKKVKKLKMLADFSPDPCFYTYCRRGWGGGGG
jgi:hypothetical protein